MEKQHREAGMSRPNPGILFAILVVFLVIFGGPSLYMGGLYIGKHEGDTLHMMEIVLRMADGQIAHLDFSTPIGSWAFAPIAYLVQAGFGIGHAFVLAQVLVAVAFIPLVWWVSVSRLTPPLAAVFGLVIMVLLLALVHGEANPAVSVSMHYNRWAWAAAFVAILAALIPPAHPKNPTLDGIVVALMMTAMVMIKVTYFAAFAVPVALGLYLTGQRRALAVAVVAGVAMVAALTAWLGVDYWRAYVSDLLSVASSDVRPNPGKAFGAVLGSPAYLGASLVAVMSVILLRQAREMTVGLVLLLLVPGFFYVTYQNFGNDPQWLMLLAILLFAFRPHTDITNPSGWNLRQAILICGVVAAAFATPSFVNMAYSPFRHARTNVAEFTPMLPRGGVNADLFAATKRVLLVNGIVARDAAGSGYDYDPEVTGAPAPLVFMGETLEQCSLESGLVAFFDTISRDLETAGYGGSRIFAADLFSSFWLYGDFDPLVGGSPWNYGGLPGYASADFLLVPSCPTAPKLRSEILTEIEAAGTDALSEVRRTPIYVLYEITRS